MSYCGKHGLYQIKEGECPHCNVEQLESSRRENEEALEQELAKLREVKKAAEWACKAYNNNAAYHEIKGRMRGLNNALIGSE